MLSLISLFLRFPSYFPQIQDSKNTWPTFSSYQAIASYAYGIGFVEETRTTRDHDTFLDCVYASFNKGKVSKVSNKKFPYFRAI